MGDGYDRPFLRTNLLGFIPVLELFCEAAAKEKQEDADTGDDKTQRIAIFGFRHF